MINTDKRDTLLCLVGKDSQKATREIMKQRPGTKLEGKPMKSMVVLGATLRADGKVGEEIQIRIAAGRRSYLQFSKVWHSEISKTTRRSAYTAVVESHLLSALGARVLKARHYVQLD